jgi:thymidine kinase
MKDIQVITGCMFAGKTTELINRLKLLNKKYLLVKPKLDTRDIESQICTHDGVFEDAIQVNNLSEIFNKLKGIEVLGIDEAQFFNESIIKEIEYISSKGISIVIAGLAKDYLNKSFGCMDKMIQISTSITWLKAECNRCKKSATYSHRKPNYLKDQVLIGDENQYEALCETCFKKIN